MCRLPYSVRLAMDVCCVPCNERLPKDMCRVPYSVSLDMNCDVCHFERDNLRICFMCHTV